MQVPLGCVFFCPHWTVHVHKQVLLEPHLNPATKCMNIWALHCPYSNTTSPHLLQTRGLRCDLWTCLTRNAMWIVVREKRCRRGSLWGFIWRCSFRSGTPSQWGKNLGESDYTSTCPQFDTISWLSLNKNAGSQARSLERKALEEGASLSHSCGGVLDLHTHSLRWQDSNSVFSQYIPLLSNKEGYLWEMPWTIGSYTLKEF